MAFIVAWNDIPDVKCSMWSCKNEQGVKFLRRKQLAYLNIIHICVRIIPEILIVRAEKKILRQSLAEKRSRLTSEEVANYSKVICEKIWDFVVRNKIDIIHTYLPIKNEVDTYALIERALLNEKIIIVPKTLADRAIENLHLKSVEHLVRGKFNTLHPGEEIKYEGKIDLIIIPGLGFDQKNNRLGFGAGYYDKFLRSQPNAVKMGIAYPFQLLDEIPSEPHDIKMDLVISP
ncbi:5-formyltetrahydrofolate cyclo-ligase [Flexithrix dorotheae]|uniref:5-formyltetrahydrofolate cyclo-ligase n=1 Tax=Flexithrix dorotheae TaxID=70993 RepID=UPI0003683218|nr:5-formyltetrahydrofolate cyclo-ligase [Flexithrix dorotheae]